MSSQTPRPSQRQRSQSDNTQNRKCDFKKNYYYQALLYLIIGANISPAIAQSNTSTNSSSTSPQPIALSEVVVTGEIEPNPTENTGSFTTDAPINAATGMDLTLRETPQSVSVITRERMDQQGLTSITDVFQQTTGLFVTGEGTAGSPIGGSATVYSRGFQVKNFQIDGMLGERQTWASESEYGGGVGSIDTAIYDSFTVVRGATGLMTGAGDPSASVNMTRKRPTHEFQGYLEGGVGRWDQRRVVADFGGPLNQAGTLRGRVVGAYDKGKSWVRSYKGDRSVVYGVIEADLTDKTLFNVSIEHAEESSNAHNREHSYGLFFSDGNGLSPFGRHDSLIVPWADWSNRRDTFSVSLEHHFDEDWNAKIVYSHTQRDHHNKRLDYNYGVTPDLMFERISAYNREEKYKINGIDFRLNGKFQAFERSHDIIAGFNATKPEVTLLRNARFHSYDTYINNGIPVIDEPDWDSLNSYAPGITTTGQSGFFLAGRLRPTDQLSLILGGRWSTWKNKSIRLPGNSGYDPANPVWQDIKYKNEFTSYAGIVYDLSSGYSVYGSITETFIPQSVEDVNGNILDPEEGINYEVGAKGEWFGGRLNGSLALFQSKKDNMAIRDSDDMFTPDGGWAYRAADNVTTRGYELELAGELAGGWHLQGGYSRSIHRDSDGTNLNTTIPIHQVNFFSSYALQRIPGLTIGGGANWQSKIYSTRYDNYGLRDLSTQKAYAVVNLMAHYAFTDQLSLTVNLNNAFNKNYRVSPTEHSYGAERNLSASLKYRF